MGELWGVLSMGVECGGLQMNQKKVTYCVRNPDVWPDTRGFNPDSPSQEYAAKYNEIIDGQFAGLSDCQKLEYKKLKDRATHRALKLSKWLDEELQARLRELSFQEYGAVANNSIILLFASAAASMVLIFLDLISPFYVLSLTICLTAFLVIVLVNQSFAEGLRSEAKLKIEALLKERDELSCWFISKGLNEKCFIDSALFGERLLLDAFKLDGITGKDISDLWDEEMNMPDSLKYIRAWLDLNVHEELMNCVNWQSTKSG
jgi:hypothetical protein